MAADLYIHVLSHLSEDVVKRFKSTSLGSKWHNCVPYQKATEHSQEDYLDVGHTPQIWIGEVSWLKASLFEDSETYIPDPVLAVATIVGEDFRIIDDTMIQEISTAMSLPNNTNYSIASKEQVVAFLTQNLGEKTFHVSW